MCILKIVIHFWEFVVLSIFIFYNRNQDIGERTTLRLSDSFVHGNEQSGMELGCAIDQVIEDCIEQGGLSF